MSKDGGVSNADVQIERLRRKVKQRDERIAGMARRIALLESTLATAELARTRLPIDVMRAVQEALCNVRMIPVFGRESKILRVEQIDAAKKGA